MFWLRLYENIQLTRDHFRAYLCTKKGTGPGFLNAVNKYYQERLWR